VCWKQGDNDADTSTCSTDTEKQLEKVQAENKRLASEISSLHRFYTRNPTATYCLQSEQIRVRTVTHN
jgi:hypothetical protein